MQFAGTPHAGISEFLDILQMSKILSQRYKYCSGCIILKLPYETKSLGGLNRLLGYI